MQFLRQFLGGSDDTALNVQEANERIKQKKGKPYLLDVRSLAEFQTGTISGAKLIPLHELQQRQNELPSDREIICVCQSGSRSGMAARKLRQAGYNALNLRGGMLAWRRAGYPIKKGKLK